MPKITLDVSMLQKQAIEALAEQDGVTVDDLFAPWVLDLTNNRGGIDPTDSEADQQARADKLTARAAERKAARAAEAKAAAEAAEKA
jgi:transposase-like protein